MAKDLFLISSICLPRVATPAGVLVEEVVTAAAAVSSPPPPPELASEVAAAASEAKELFSMAIEGLCTFFTQILIS